MNLTDSISTDEATAREHFEAIRWPDVPYCPHCGETEKVYRLNGKSHCAGLLHCNSCDEAFTVTVGTVMERSHVPLHKWALAFRLFVFGQEGLLGAPAAPHPWRYLQVGLVHGASHS
jgi:transposase-like protein